MNSGTCLAADHGVASAGRTDHCVLPVSSGCLLTVSSSVLVESPRGIAPRGRARPEADRSRTRGRGARTRTACSSLSSVPGNLCRFKAALRGAGSFTGAVSPLAPGPGEVRTRRSAVAVRRPRRPGFVPRRSTPSRTAVVQVTDLVPDQGQKRKVFHLAESASRRATRSCHPTARSPSSAQYCELPNIARLNCACQPPIG